MTLPAVYECGGFARELIIYSDYTPSVYCMSVDVDQLPVVSRLIVRRSNVRRSNVRLESLEFADGMQVGVPDGDYYEDDYENARHASVTAVHCSFSNMSISRMMAGHLSSPVLKGGAITSNGSDGVNAGGGKVTVKGHCRERKRTVCTDNGIDRSFDLEFRRAYDWDKAAAVVSTACGLSTCTMVTVSTLARTASAVTATSARRSANRSSRSSSRPTPMTIISKSR